MTIDIASALATRGRATNGFLTVSDASDPGTSIPVTVLAGAKAGPVLALVAGTHGSEPSPILALQRVRAMVTPAELTGSVIIVQIANVPSFQERTVYRGPWDRKNLNRVFPGRADGTASERIAHAITAEVIDRCDYLVDMHSGDGNEALRPYAYWNKLGLDDGVDAAARELVLAFGLDHIVVDRARPRDRAASLFCANTAQTRGKPAITTEAGELGVPTDDAVVLNVRGAMSVMRHLGMIAGSPERVERPVWIEPSEVLVSPATGIWYADVAPDQHVKRGDTLGHVTDYFGTVLETVVSPLDGVVLYVVRTPAMARGEPVAMVGVMNDRLSF